MGTLGKTWDDLSIYASGGADWTGDVKVDAGFKWKF